MKPLNEIVRRQMLADFASREARIKDALVQKVYEAMAYVDYKDYGEPDSWGEARAAVDVFIQFLKDPISVVGDL
jgi:hypothetical protein